MNQYLKELYSAFREVGIENYYWNAISKNGENYIQEAENNFSTEIIGNFRNIMRLPQNQARYNNLKCHFDILKARVNLIRPDIVLHESTDNKNKQIFYCEVKIDSYCNLKEDLEKLIVAVSDDLSFENAIMIVANRTLVSTIKQIRNYMQNESATHLKKFIYFMLNPRMTKLHLL
ncbi:hypothetical protein OWR28_06095 [Chryseobacterium sp. 1B4]